MSNAIHTPPDAPGSTTDVPPPIDYERIPPTGVRKVPVTEMDDRPRVRWGAIFAGLLLSTGGQILLWLLGFAVGMAVIASPASRATGAGFGMGTAIWVALVLVATLYAGGYFAARLGGAVLRSEGVLSGALVWAVSAIAILWLVGGSAMMGMTGVPRFDGPQMQQFAPGPGPYTRGPMGAPPAMGNAEFLEPQPFPPPPRVTPADLSRAAWGAFAYAAISLLGALAGGARGATRRTAARSAA
jgi:hypothetical protein